MMEPKPHHYQRDVFSAHAESLSKISARMVRGAQVLELGPAAGYFTRILKTALDCTVDAIEIDAAMAAKAKPYCRDILVSDLDSLDWFETFPQRTYDAIIAADVLEHLRSPERVLRALRSRLKPGGKLFISLPNVAYAGMIFGLLEDDFRYRAEGLLDRTHLKFFTRATLEETLAATGWSVSWRGEVRKDVYEAEFHTRVEKWPQIVREHVLEHPSRAAYQLLCECVPGDVASITDDIARDPVGAQFSARLMWGASPALLSFENGEVVFGEIGRMAQALRWTVPVAAQCLRIRLTDRIGTMRVREILVKSSPKVPTAQLSEVIPLNDCTLSDDITRNGDTLMLGSAESWLQLPLGDVAAGAEVTVVCDWPMSSDYVEAAQLVETTKAAAKRSIEELQHANVRLNEVVAGRERLIAERDALLQQTNAHVLHLEQIAQDRADLVVQRDAQLDALQAQFAAVQASARDVEHERDQARQTIAANEARIVALRSFRVWWRHRFPR